MTGSHPHFELKRFHRHYAADRLDCAGNLRRDFEAPRQFDFDLAAVAEEEDHADFALTLIGTVARRSAALETTDQTVNRDLVTQEHAQPLLSFCRRVIEGL